MKIVSKNVKRLRLEKGLMQWQLGDLAGISQSYICYIENGSKGKARLPTDITISKLRKLAKAFNCTVGDLTDEINHQ